MDLKASENKFYKIVVGFTYLICVYLVLSSIGGVWFRENDGFWQENSDLRVAYSSISIVIILSCLVSLWGFYKRKSWGLIPIISICLLLIYIQLGMPVYGYYLAHTEYKIEISLIELVDFESVLISFFAVIALVGWSSKSFRTKYHSL